MSLNIAPWKFWLPLAFAVSFLVVDVVHMITGVWVG
jgi:hypothetical protein